MRGQLLVPAALVALLLAESHAWVAPPRPRPPTPTPRPPASRPPVGRAKPEFRNSFDAARARSATEAANLLRTQGALIGRRERAAMLNLIAYQMLRQRQSASLTELRQLRSDWRAAGPGMGLDPIVAMELEAAESAAERLLLAEVLKLIADGRFADAHAKLDFLESPRYLPAVVVQTLPALRMWLQQTVPFVQMQAALKREGVSFKEAWQPVASVARDRMPPVLAHAADIWRSLEHARQMLLPGSSPSVSEMEAALKDATSTAGVELANKLRVELAAKLFLLGRSHDAETLLESDLDPIHAATVLADLRTAVLGRGEIITPQIARFVPLEREHPSPASTAILPPEQLAKWKTPIRKSGETTINTAIKDVKERVNTAVHAAVVLRTAKVNETASCIRAALAAEAEPLKAFLDKLEAARGKPFTSDVERHLAVASATRGLTVAETAGVLAADADRPAVAARLLANVPVFTNPGAFTLAVEVAGRAPAAFAAYPDAGFKLTGAVTRARLRDAVAAVLNTHAAKVVAELAPPPLDRAALEAEVAKRLSGSANAIPPVEYVQALLDTCRDWAEDHVRLKEAVSELNDAIAILEAGGGEPDEDAKDVLALAKTHRIAMQLDRKRREVGVTVGCRLLGEYGKAATSARDWLREQMQTAGQPWREDAENTLKNWVLPRTYRPSYCDVNDCLSIILIAAKSMMSLLAWRPDNSSRDPAAYQIPHPVEIAVFRLFLATATLATAASFAPAADEPPKPKAKAQQLKGEVNPLQRMAPDFVGDSTLAYMADVSVTLKAGQDISLTCTVTGKDRHVLLVLLDPRGMQIGISKSKAKTTTLHVEDVNANGEYKILVFTSLIGPFSLWATISSEEELNIKAIEEEIKILQQLLADAEARLKKAKTKKP